MIVQLAFLNMDKRNLWNYFNILALIWIFNLANVWANDDLDSDESDYNARDEFYDKCSTGQDGIRCTGIPSNCVSSRNCDYGVGYWEDETHLWSTLIGPDNGKPYVAVLGLTPFEKSGNNLTATCKSRISLDDIRVIFYKMKASETGTGLENKSVWTSGTQAFGNIQPAWGYNCLSKFKYANGFYKMNPEDKRDLLLNGEFVYLQYAVNPDQLNPLYGELSGLFDSNQYSSVDGVVFTNF